MYLGKLKLTEKVGVDAQRYVEKIKPIPSSGGTFEIRSRFVVKKMIFY